MIRLVALVLVCAGSARAASVRVDGSYRMRLDLNSNYQLDSMSRIGQTIYALHRLRLSPKIVQEGEIEVQASFDVLSGLFAGELAPHFQDLGYTERSQYGGIHASGFDFRYLFTTIRLPGGMFALGQMPNDWAMGMLINGGNQEEALDFGDMWFGDIVDRASFTTRPLAFLGPRSHLARTISLTIAGDLIYRDRYASLVTTSGTGGLRWGDTAWQVVAKVGYDPAPETKAGLYVARRIQSYAVNAGDLHVWIFDAHARTILPLGSFGGVLALEAEAAEIFGGTSHVPNLNTPGTARVAAQGAVGRATLSRGQLEVEIEGGYASGDGNPFDDAVTTFQFSRDYKVGLVLFDELVLFQSQNAARRLSDPHVVGRPPTGIDLIPTEGAVTNAIYLRPTLRWTPPWLASRVRLVGSAVFARAPQPFIDPYQTLVAGAAVNAFGAPAGQSYGTEIDAAVSFRSKIADPLGIDLGVQVGHLFPGNAFRRSDGSNMPGVTATRLRATLLF